MSSNLHRRLVGSGLPPKGPTPVGSGRSGARSGPRSARDYSPLPWSKYFEAQTSLELDSDHAFHLYSIGLQPSSPTHPDSPAPAPPSPVMVLLHGGGFSGLTWALTAQALAHKVRVRVLALDLRGHGQTRTSKDHDLSAEVMAQDVIRVLRHQFPEELPEIVLVGHSMGGALAVHAALTHQIDRLLGVCVIDVVEGSAMEALGTMQGFLRSRPDKFPSLENAIEWDVRSGQVRNAESARVSMPGQLKNIETQVPATIDIDQGTTSTANPGQDVVMAAPADAIPEEEEETSGEFKAPSPVSVRASAPKSGYTWRIDLARSEYYWPGWFQGLSNKFLSVPCAKLLLLAGVDRLDRDLTVGQMQGKFQMQVLPQAGHAVQEDMPDQVADILATFLVRNKFAQPADDFERTFPAC
ncbi:hypothetical protein TCAL_04149 [Tigriopus californicus]|uniref:Protein phosphatase methylesterase 1 n=1 Tax=Tigriopus californicus TaxID=6832 RepID=A0A553NS73_TIGCA|nr:protein phosphatase methylesterase 1-like [Tigriopus californicus]TRY68284.1 hypothetical protein TCAL_04149 [Tigriopus californicus]|eukprot:TCALIF_04149-PA protein Name:"Similar to Ppme1 Protein phosphatase methylesterase 1 (Mus musculus)" AED:0.05 eAED:0.05 QI:103/1/1/1/1/1/2/15/410